MFISKAFQDVVEKNNISGYIWHKLFIQTVKCSFFSHIIVYLKWYMKCFIHWTADLKSSELWSWQLRTQFKQLRIEAWKSQDLTLWYQCDTPTNWAMNPLTLGAGHLWVLMSLWRMDVKWYMKCFIYWSADHFTIFIFLLFLYWFGIHLPKF